MELTDLPNIGPVLAGNLKKIGVDTPEQLRELGAEGAFLKIRGQVDPGACLHQLEALAGAEAGVQKPAPAGAQGPAEELVSNTLRRMLCFKW